MIGEEELKNGLYILKNQGNFCGLSKNQDYETLHKRLGHPSEKVLSNFFNFPLRNCISCDVCKLAKQIRLPFSLSTSKSK
jgi:GAG-pre-integrase domain